MIMRTLVILCFVGLTTITIHAQNLFEFGVKAGVNHAFPNSLSNGIESEDNFGWQAGAFVQFGVFDMLALATELTVDKRSFTMIQGEDRLDVNTTSLNIPVLLRIGLPLKLMLELGPQYTHFLSTDNSTSTDGQGFAALGLIWKPAFGLQFDIRFLRGLTSISTPMDGDVNVNVSQFSIGYQF